jgi:hypothetical protein
MSTLINPHDTELEEVILSACMMEREAYSRQAAP